MLSFLNLFPQSITFKYLGDKEFNTGKGLISSLIIFLFLGATTYYFGKEVIQKQFPVIVPSQFSTQYATLYEMTPETFPLAFGLQDYSTWQNFRDQTLVYPEIVYSKTILVADPISGEEILTFEQTVAEPELCDEKIHFKHNKLTREWIDSVPFDQLYCLPNNGLNIIGGNIDLSDSYNVGIRFIKCNEEYASAKGITCASPQEYTEKMKAMYYIMYFPKTVFDPVGQPPIKTVGQAAFTTLSSKFPKEIEVFLNRMEVNTDWGVMMEEMETILGVNTNPMREMLVDLDDTVMTLYFYMSLTEKKYEVKFKKVQQVFAQVGGFLSIAMEILVLLLIPFNYFEYQLSFINELFQIEDQNDQQQYDQSVKKSQVAAEFSSQNFHQRNFNFEKIENLEARNSINQTHKNHNQDFKTEFEDNNQVELMKLKMKRKLKKSQKGLQISSCQQITHLLGCQIDRRKEQLLHKAQQSLNQQIDMVYLVKKICEFERLKKVVLDEEQLQLFSFIEKPSITFDSLSGEAIFHNLQIMDEISKVDLDRRIEDTFFCYAQLRFENKNEKNDQKSTQLDRIIKVLSPALISLFETTYNEMGSEEISNFIKNFIPQNNRESNLLMGTTLDEQPLQQIRNQITKIPIPSAVNHIPSPSNEQMKITNI